MKISPLNIVLNKTFKPDKKFYFISGNEKTLMEKIKSKIIERIQEEGSAQIINIDTISGFDSNYRSCLIEVGLKKNAHVGPVL